MEIYLDTANVNDIKKISNMIKINGITTNPSSLAKECVVDTGIVSSPINVLKNVIETTGYKSDISIELVSTNIKDALIEINKIEEKLNYNCSDSLKFIVFKIPVTSYGYKLIRELKLCSNFKINATLVFNPLQALLASKAGADYVSVFVGRIDDHEGVGMGLKIVQDIKTIFKQYGINTKIIVASVRNEKHIIDSALAGADIVTVPPKFMYETLEHPLTTDGVNRFMKSWELVKW